MATIRTLQRKLYRKAKQEPAYRFYALYHKIYRADILSHAYHLVRALNASDDVVDAMFQGHNEVIDADISKYFDAIPHANLMATVAERICDDEILHHIQMWLKAPIMEQDKDGTKRNVGGGKGSRKGTPQSGLSEASDRATANNNLYRYVAPNGSHSNQSLHCF